MASPLKGLELAKQVAAFRAVDKYVAAGNLVGVGSGSTVKYVVQRLAEREKAESLGCRFVATSYQSKALLEEEGLRVEELGRNTVLDVAIDGADEVDPQLNLIKGGGGCQTQEKIVASAAKLFVVVADHRKESQRLGTKWTKGVPVEVVPMAVGVLQRRIQEELGLDAVLRMGTQKAGPVVTDNSGFILDVQLKPEGLEDAADLDAKLRAMPGVVETGLFVGMAEHAYFGQEDGSINKWSRKHPEPTEPTKK